MGFQESQHLALIKMHESQRLCEIKRLPELASVFHARKSSTELVSKYQNEVGVSEVGQE